jgi:LmbE family N-acetylglucosaminyl deacetylase
LGSVVWEDKSVNVSPEDFVRLGEERMVEGKRAMKVLGMSSQNLTFLGYPDKGLWPMLTKFFNQDKPYMSSGTKLDHNPYRETYKPGRIYAGENVVLDLKEIIEQFSPSVVIVSHPRDSHSDHQAAFQFLQKALEGEQIHPKVFSYLVHYRFFPPETKFSANEFLYPPRRLFTPQGWFSYELSSEEEQKKLEAVNQYKSQVKRDPLPRAMVRRNEIFEEMEE